MPESDETVMKSLAWLEVGDPGLTVTSQAGFDETLVSERGAGVPLVLDHYRIVDELGAGGMGVVYLARDQNLQRKVALKCARAGEDEQLKRFVLEAQITALLDHPGIVPVYALEASEDGSVAYTMKPVEGSTLKDEIERLRARYVEEGNTRPFRRAQTRLLERFVRVCEAVHFAHVRGVVHRDLKPENVMLGAHHEVYVVDWGLAKIGEDAVEQAVDPEALHELAEVDATQDGIIKGTPIYMAPEQARGLGPRIGPHSDCYALGMILYELLYLQRAREGTNLTEILLQAREGEFVDVPEDLDRSAELAAVWRKATRKEPGERYASVEELADDVRHVLHGEETVVLPDRGGRKLRRWVSRHPRSATLASSALFVTLGMGWALTTVQQGQARARAALAAEQREDAFAAVAVHTGRVARRLAIALAEFEGQARTIAAAGEEVLRHGEPGGVRPLPPAAFHQPSAEHGIQRSEYYGGQLIGTRALMGRAPDAAGSADLALLGRLYRRLRTPFTGELRGEEADRAIVEHRVPIEWTYVALERSGAVVFFPGNSGGETQDGYDPRKRDWYREAVGAYREGGRDLVWSRPYWDKLGQGMVVTCCAVLHDDVQPLGVAAVDLSLKSLAADLHREAQGLPGFEHAVLLGEGYRVLVSSGPRAASTEAEVGAEHPATKTLRAAGVREGGTLRLKGRLYAWSRVPRLGWVLLIEVNEDQLLAAFAVE